MNLNDYLHVSPTIFDDGWVEQEPPPIPPSLEGKVGKIRAFFNASRQIGINISLEERSGPIHLHLSMRHNGGIRVSDEEVPGLINLFFPGAVMATSHKEFADDCLWGEKRGVGLLPVVRHFIKII